MISRTHTVVANTKFPVGVNGQRFGFRLLFFLYPPNVAALTSSLPS
jgi:hypothetical protein